MYTAGVLGARIQRAVPATFFVVGYEAAANPGLLRAEAGAGMSVEDHTWIHADLTRLSPAAINSELDSTADVIQSATGIRPSCFRPPYGTPTSTVTAEPRASASRRSCGTSTRRTTCVRAQRRSPLACSANINGAGLLVGIHDGGGDRSQTIAALPAIIDGLRARWYTFVRLCG